MKNEDFLAVIYALIIVFFFYGIFILGIEIRK